MSKRRILGGSLVAAGLLACGLSGCGDANGEDASKQAAAEDKASLKIKSEPIQPIRAPEDLRASTVELGRKLFHDKRFSQTGDVSCSTCHVVASGGVDGAQHSKGVHDKEGAVNALTVLNSGFNFALFWDGRAATLEEQAGGPLVNPDEMAFSWDAALDVVKKDTSYAQSFKNDFPDGVTEANVRKAIATYERALVTPSRFDKWLLGDASAITDDERKGYELFKSVGCIACHQGRNVGGNMFQKLGVMGDYFKDRGNVVTADYGRFNVTKAEDDKFRFRVPSLRNVAKTAPYFHDGTKKTLQEAIRTMARYQLGRPLSDEDVGLLEKFLRSLSGDLPDGLGDPGASKQ